MEGDAELLVIATALRLDGNRDNGSGEVDRLENDRLFGIAKRIARTGLGKTDTRDDISGAGLFERLLLVSVHAEETGNALLLTDRGVEEFGAELHRTRVNADERDLTHVLIGHDLERETAERLVVGNLALLLGIVLRDGRTRVERRRKVIANGVEERLNALILERTAAESGSNRTGEAALADSLLNLVDREILTGEELLHESVVLLGGGLDHLLAPFGGLLGVLFGDVLLDNGLTEALHIEVESLHLDEVDNTLERLGRADRDNHRNGVGLELSAHLLHNAVEVGADAVHLVDERDLRHFILLGLTPNLFGLGLNAADRAVKSDRAVENAQRALHFGRKVNVSGSIDERESVVTPRNARSGGLNRNAALLLLNHKVHRSGAVMYFAELIVLARIVKNTFGRRRLAAVDVGHDAEVTHSLERDVAFCHLSTPFVLKDVLFMVGAEGFEPPTACSQSRCATRLRYAPKV